MLVLVQACRLRQAVDVEGSRSGAYFLDKGSLAYKA